MGEDMEEVQATEVAQGSTDPQEKQFVKYVVIGEFEDGATDMMFSDDTMHIKDLLVYKEVLQGRIDSIVTPQSQYLMEGLIDISKSVNHVIAEVSKLRSEIETLKQDQ
jgi:hypothetical protein